MILLKNLGINEFRHYIKENNKLLFVFGAGKLTRHFVDICDCYNELIAIVDNNSQKQELQFDTCDISKKVITPKQFCDTVKKHDKTHISLVVVPPQFSAEIVDQLNKYPELDGLETFVYTFMRNTNESTSQWCFPDDCNKIPKYLHYIWVGKKEIPDKLKECIDSWYRYNPDYQIKMWNEDNYDFSAIPFMREAYENEEWGFASNVARLDIVYKYGGIYLDTDVELFYNLDCLLNTEAFFCMACSDRINTGVGFGGVAKHQIIKSMLDVYRDKKFIDENGRKKRFSVFFEQHKILKDWGINLNNEFQIQNGVAVYPAEVLSPNGILGFGEYRGEHTIGVHLDYGSWRTGKEKKALDRLNQLLID